MRKTLGVCLLGLLLTGSASAGEIPNDRPDPSKPTNAVQEPTADGIIPNNATDGLTQAALNLLALLPSLL
jgi:hypothetical protein